MKVSLAEDELYPYYSLTKSKVWVDYEVEITEEEYERYQAVTDEFFDWQAKLADLIDHATPPSFGKDI